MKKTIVKILALSLGLVVISTSVSAHGHDTTRNNNKHREERIYTHHDEYEYNDERYNGNCANNQANNYKDNATKSYESAQNNAMSMDELITYYEKLGITIEKVTNRDATLTTSEEALVNKAIKDNNLTGNLKDCVDYYHVTYNDHAIYDEEHHLEATVTHDVTIKMHHDGTFRQILAVNNDGAYCNEDHYTLENTHNDMPCFNNHRVSFNSTSGSVKNHETHHYGYNISNGLYKHVENYHNQHDFSGCNDVFELYPHN